MHLNFVMCSIDSMHFTATDPQHTSYVSIRYKACRTQTNELTADTCTPMFESENISAK